MWEMGTKWKGEGDFAEETCYCNNPGTSLTMYITLFGF